MKEEQYGGKFKDHLIEQYKSYVDMAIQTSKRRDQANRFYLLILSGLLAFLSILFANDFVKENQNVFLLAFGSLGFFVCVVWFISIHSYKILSKAKYDVIREVEKNLPYPCYKEEWEILEKEKYLQITKVEKIIPVIFAVPYVILIIYSIYNLCPKSV